MDEQLQRLLAPMAIRATEGCLSDPKLLDWLKLKVMSLLFST